MSGGDSTRPAQGIMDALQEVGAWLQELQRSSARQGEALPEPRRLLEADEKLSVITSNVLREPPPSRRERALAAWHRWTRGQGGMPTATLVRTLCWEREVVGSKGFERCLEPLQPLRGRALQALFLTYNRSLWNGDRGVAARTEAILRQGFAALRSARGSIALWREVQDELLGAQSYQRFAHTCLANRLSVRSRMADLQLPTDTEFACLAAGELLSLATGHTQPIDVAQWALDQLLPDDWQIAAEGGWGPAMGNLILNQEFSASEVAREQVMDFAMANLGLGDPRASDGPWRPIGDEAIQEVIRWRSSEDLRFFFDLVMKGKLDHQGRHRFWQKYVDGVSRSMIVLSRADETRLRPKLRELEKKGRRFSILSGSNQTSAFVMQLGRIIVVEFSEAGNACYIYAADRDEEPIPWRARSVEIQTLKNQKRSIKRLIHGQKWEWDFNMALSRLGVRPGLRKRRS
ncbi:MAG: EH signature domain-containing protein [Myxococcota bacterium]